MIYRQKKIQVGSYTLELLPFIITLIGIIFLITLGCWQLFRLQEKNAFIASVSRNLSNHPTVYDDKIPQAIYRKIKLSGRFLSGKDIYLYGRKAMAPEKEGYYLLSPFQTLQGNIIMVARGWFAAKNKLQISAANISAATEITGITLPLEKKRMFIPNNDLKNNTWFTLEHQEMNSYTQETLENFYLLEIDPENLPANVIAINPEGLIKIKNDHLEYALTWFCLSICLGIIFAVYTKQKNNRKN